MGYSVISKNLIVGDYKSAQDLNQLQSLGVTHIVACGFERGFFVRNFRYFLVNILDAPTSNLLQHLPRATNFIKRALDENGVVYIHCVHGQSRSCAVCIAFLMHTCLPSPAPSSSGEIEQDKILHACYNIVKTARPCMAVNPGFVRQLDIFRRMKCVPKNTATRTNMASTCSNHEPGLILSRAHAAFRTFRAKGEFYNCGQISKYFCPLDTDASSNKFYVCQSCNEKLLTDQNVVVELSSDEILQLPVSDYWMNSSGGKEYYAQATSRSNYSNKLYGKILNHAHTVLKAEPMQWMRRDMTNCEQNIIESRGILLCPKCTQEVGHWDWCHPDPSSCIVILRARVDLVLPVRKAS